MRRIILISLLIIYAVTSDAAKTSVIADRIDPPFWWTGMECDTLQLMFYGKGISSAEISTSYPGVEIMETVRPDSPDYLFAYLRIGKDTEPGEMPLDITLGKKQQRVEYKLKPKTGLKPEFCGFDASDVLYLVMPDRFADGDTLNNSLPGMMKYPAEVNRSRPGSRHGGDIAGLSSHLGYVDSLGVTAIWVNPVLENDMPGGSYHGYATTDYYRIDPRFGTNGQWNSFVSEANERGLKVVMDMIFNHCGSGHVWLAEPPFRDWFNFPDTAGFVQTNYRLTTLHDPYVSDFDLSRTVDGWFVRAMPDLNQRNPHLMRYLVQNSIWWIEESKISGIRMDTYPYADMKAMGKWIDSVEKEYPGFNIVGECWYSSEGGEAFWQSGSRASRDNTHLKTVMDFRLAIDASKAFGENTGSSDSGLNRIYDHLALDFLFADPQRILTFLDNHDTDRFLREQPSDLGSWKQALTFLLTSRGIPQIYYGTELLMSGTRESGGDGIVRPDIPGGFPGDTVSHFTAAGRTELQNEAYDYLSSLLSFRKGKANDVIAGGTLKHFMPYQGIYVYERRLGDRRIIVMMNGNDREVTADMSQMAEILPAGTVLPDFISGENVEITPRMTFAPRQIVILTQL